MKYKCYSCIEEKEPYYEGCNVCENCVVKFDKNIEEAIK